MDFSLCSRKAQLLHSLSLSFISVSFFLCSIFCLMASLSVYFANVFMALHLVTDVTGAHFLLRCLPLVPTKRLMLPLLLMALSYLEVPARELSTICDVLSEFQEKVRPLASHNNRPAASFCLGFSLL